MNKCEQNGCQNTSLAGGTQQISIYNPETKQKIVKVLCSEHYGYWKKEIYQLAVSLQIIKPQKSDGE